MLILRYFNRYKKSMNITTLSPKFQIVIPAQVRQHMELRQGMKFRVISYNDRIELIPLQPMPKMRGFLKGMDTNMPRQADRKL